MAGDTTIKDAVRTFVLTEIVGERAHREELADTTELVKSGLLDSISVLGLVDFIEEEYEIELEMGDIKEFKSIAKIAEIVESKTS